LVTGSGAPTASMVYKLVARAESGQSGSGQPDGVLVPVAKRSPDKPSQGGRKYAYRRIDGDGVATAEVVGIGEPPADLADRGRNLVKTLMVNGQLVDRATLEEGRELHRRSLVELPISASQLSRGDAVIPTVY